ncbi:MFS general substrate transporter [Auricularia subglabra TFB-10046 SS5]|nr:MFS general substrate transporter [Auricularia subglabra TFB-10046 SS5]
MTSRTTSPTLVHERRDTLDEGTKERFSSDPADPEAPRVEPTPTPGPDAAAAFEIPDGGARAWATICGAWFIMFATFGAVSSFGVFEDYYVRVYLTNHTASDVAWIGSVQLFFVHAVGVIAGKLFDDGYFHHLQIGGGTLYIICTFLLSLARPRSYYQIFLAQGVGAGIGLGLVFLPTAAVISHHFQRRRALAVGIAYSGSSAGGVALPIMMNKLLHSHLSFGNAVRAFAGLLAGCLVIGNALVRTRLPPKSKRPPVPGPQPSFKAFLMDVPFMCAVAASGLLALALFFPLFYIQLDAVLHGVDANLSFYLITALNAASIPGRLLPTFLADRFGIFNIQIFCGAASGAVVLGMLGIGSSPAPPIVLAILYGFFTGAIISLATPMTVALSNHVNEIGSRIGLVFLALGISSLLGSPIAGWLLTSRYTWWKPITFSAVMWMASIVVFLPARASVARKKGSNFV